MDANYYYKANKKMLNICQGIYTLAFVVFSWLGILTYHVVHNTKNKLQEGVTLVAIEEDNDDVVLGLCTLDSLSRTQVCDSTALSLIVRLKIQHPHIALAQMKIESGNYSSNVSKEYNNYFGMRHPAQRLTVSLGNKNGYAHYRDWAYSILDYALWQRRYAYNLSEEEYLYKLAQVYAEDTNYRNKVEKLSKTL